MNIQITTKSGQKYLLKDIELVEQFREFAVADYSEADGSLVKAVTNLRDFLSTYEKVALADEIVDKIFEKTMTKALEEEPTDPIAKNPKCGHMV